MSVQLERLARNQVLFREVNERLREIVADSPGPVEFLCECSKENCTMQIQLEILEYERVRAHPSRFVIAPEHEIDAIERVVWESDRYFVVEKVIGADYARKVDPRKRSGT